MITHQQYLAAKILIVDDQPPNVLLLETILKTAGYINVRSTTDSREVALLYAEIQPDLLLLDLNMPHVDGFELLEQLSMLERENYIPVLVLTAQTDRSSRLRALQLGAKDFLTKPFEQAEVLMRIRNILEVRLLHKAIAEQNRVLEEKVQERTIELHETQTEIVRRLARAAAYRDGDTRLHVFRMSRFAAHLGRAAGLSEEECDLMLQTTPMHDIGKIGIPDAILLKPEKLTPEEWEIMQTHTTIGADLLSGSQSPLLQMAHTIALTHHENWDGTGYPKGLREENIPLAGRICAICDTFDTLTSERPYKKAWSVEEALAEIDRVSGTQFDSRLVTLFKQIFPEILEIKQQYSDSSDMAELLAGTEKF